MEAVPLTLAHTHARNAVAETQKANPVAASEEHDLAAGEFATAAQNCNDLYALRTLKLLEEEHKRLAVLLRSQHEHPSPASPELSTTVSPQPIFRNAGIPASKGASASNPVSTTDPHQQPPRLPGHHRQLQRETSSIASNLASARGIPSNPRRASPASPTLSAQHVGAQMAESHGRAKTSDSKLPAQGGRERGGRILPAPKQPWLPPSISPTDITSQQIVPPDAHERERPRGRLSTSDEPFQRFYSTFEGLISKISAPLAFAGLPLGIDTIEPSRQKSPAETKLDRHHATSDRPSVLVEPEVKHLFSAAALQAVRDADGVMPGNPAESFYVVPTSGGTLTYAGILSRAEKEARRNSLEEAGDDDFVDARETPSSPEILQSLAGPKAKLHRGVDKSTKTMEELQMENDALRQLSDTLANRLHMWEVNAQSSSMALQQSLKAMHQHNTGSPVASSAVPTSQPQLLAAVDSNKKIKELEDIIRRSENESDLIARENEKLKVTLGRYRERWDKLKEGAKTRRNAEVAAGANSPARLGTPVSKADDEPPATSIDTPRLSGNEGGET